MFPGVPNGTEVGQEMDQSCAHLKTLCYRNRETLIKARTDANRDDTSALGLADVGWLIFGGKVSLANGMSVDLLPSFDAAFDKDHLDRAKAKCGCYPSARAALNSAKVRRVLAVSGSVDDDDDQSVEGADPTEAMCAEIESQASVSNCCL